VEFHIFVPGHWSTTKPGVGHGDGAVEKEFGCEVGGCLCGSRTGRIEAISAGTVAYAMGFGFGGAKRSFLLAVSDLAPGWYIAFLDETNCV
jgi:hypothetical protein